MQLTNEPETRSYPLQKSRTVKQDYLTVSLHAYVVLV